MRVLEVKMSLNLRSRSEQRKPELIASHRGFEV